MENSRLEEDSQCPDRKYEVGASKDICSIPSPSTSLRKALRAGAPTMKFTIKNIADNPVNLLRRAGYTFQRQENGEISFIRPLASAGYPRFHMYTKLRHEDLEVSFHLDQKKETYGDDTRHHGEYEESGTLKAEADRIKSFLTPVAEDSDFSPV